MKIGSVSSDAKKLLFGVPNGSVLGRILLYTTPLLYGIILALVSTSMQMVPSFTFIFLTRMLLMPLIGCNLTWVM